MHALKSNPEKSATKAEPDRPATLMTDVHGAASLYSVSWRTLLRWADAGLVPWGVKISGRRLWRIEDLESHIRDGCKPVRKGVRP